MKPNDRPDIRALLRSEDPLARQADLSPADAQVIRRVMLAAVQPEAGGPHWPRRLAVVAALTLTVILIAGRQTPAPDQSPVVASPAPASVTPADSSERRQLQFATPGGTRIIWVFNPELKL